MWERKERAWERRWLNRGPRIERSMRPRQKLNIIDGLCGTIWRPNIAIFYTIFFTAGIKYWAKFQLPETLLRAKNQNWCETLVRATLRLGLPTLVWRYSEARVIFPSLTVLTKKLCVCVCGCGSIWMWMRCVWESVRACVCVCVCVWVFCSRKINILRELEEGEALVTVFVQILTEKMKLNSNSKTPTTLAQILWKIKFSFIDQLETTMAVF